MSVPDRTYTCANCHGTFISNATEAEAEQEAIDNGFDLTNVDSVCEICYRRIMAWAKTRGLLP